MGVDKSIFFEMMELCPLYDLGVKAMTATARKLARNLGILALIASTATLLNSCKSAQSQQSPIKIDGSSTVLSWIHFNKGKVGTVFDGKAEFNLTIGELLRKQAKF